MREKPILYQDDSWWLQALSGAGARTTKDNVTESTDKLSKGLRQVIVGRKEKWIKLNHSEWRPVMGSVLKTLMVKDT